MQPHNERFIRLHTKQNKIKTILFLDTVCLITMAKLFKNIRPNEKYEIITFNCLGVRYTRHILTDNPINIPKTIVCTLVQKLYVYLFKNVEI